MAEQQNELTQLDVFSHIDNEMKRARPARSLDIPQKTRPNFRLVFMVNLVALLIAGAGFGVVYMVFQASEVRLVGGERSIKGLEDVLFKEIQKKASADLLRQSAELSNTQQKLAMLNDQMENLKKEQDRILKEKMDKLQGELNNKMNAEMRNKSEKEKEEIRKKYEEEMKARSSDLEKQTSQELQKRRQELAALEEEKNRLMADSRKKQQELESKQGELEKNNQELQKKLEENQVTVNKQLEELNQSMENRRITDSFNDQINILFQGAIDSYKKNEFTTVRDRLQGILRLYENKPKNVVMSKSKEDVDRFFVDTIYDYLALKDGTKDQGQKSAQEFLIALQELKDFGLQLERGDYRSRQEDAVKRYNDLQQKMPDVFAFYRNYTLFQSSLSDSGANREIRAADSLFEVRDFKNAAFRYLSVLKDYPFLSSRNTLLDRINQSVASLEGVTTAKGLYVDVEDMDKKAEPLYNRAVEAYRQKNYEAGDSQVFGILASYPNSRFAKSALPLLATNITIRGGDSVNLTAVREQDSKRSEAAYSQAVKEYNALSFDRALSGFSSVIENYPNSRYVKNSINYIDAIYKARNASLLEAQKKTGFDSDEEKKKAEPFFLEAEKNYKESRWNEALTAYRTVIENYPNSGFTKNSLSRYGSIIEITVSNRAAQTAVKSDAPASEEAEKLYREAVAAFDSGSKEAALGLFQRVIWDYSANRMARDSLTYIEKIYENRYSLTAVREEQTRQSTVLFKEATDSEAARNYEDARKKYLKVLLQYPLSGYAEKSAQSLERVVGLYITNQLSAIPVLLNTEEQMGYSIGRVVDVFDTAVTMNLTKPERLTNGMPVRIYRKQMNNSFRFISDANIVELSSIIKKARLTNRVEIPRVGDLIFPK